MSSKLVWIPQIMTAIILGMMGVMKLKGAEPPVELFTMLGMEPAGRIITGVLEITAAVMLLIPASAAYGAVLAAGIMSGAFIGHLTTIGFEGPMLKMGVMSVILLMMNLMIIYIRRSELPIIKNMFPRK